MKNVTVTAKSAARVKLMYPDDLKVDLIDFDKATYRILLFFKKFLLGPLSDNRHFSSLIDILVIQKPSPVIYFFWGDLCKYGEIAKNGIRAGSYPFRPTFAGGDPKNPRTFLGAMYCSSGIRFSIMVASFNFNCNCLPVLYPS